MKNYLYFFFKKNKNNIKNNNILLSKNVNIIFIDYLYLFFE